MFGLGFLSLIPKRLLFAVLCAAAGAAAIWGVYLYGQHEGRQQAAVAAVKAVAQAYKDRSHENENVDALDRAALCIELGGLPDECAQLRGLAEDHHPTNDGGLPGGQ